jgi:hypothetical protein
VAAFRRSTGGRPGLLPRLLPYGTGLHPLPRGRRVTTVTRTGPGTSYEDRRENVEITDAFAAPSGEATAASGDANLLLAHTRGDVCHCRYCAFGSQPERGCPSHSPALQPWIATPGELCASCVEELWSPVLTWLRRANRACSGTDLCVTGQIDNHV